jgi:NTP pyrophosphatase (non-canonical NTP hydrolase)
MSQSQDALQALVAEAHTAQAQWWLDLKTGEPLDPQRLIPEKLMLIVSELSEAMEGARKNLPDDKLPHRPMFEVELADALIRLLDLAGATGVDLGGAYVEKMAFNATRPDHQRANRMGEHGKRF